MLLLVCDVIYTIKIKNKKFIILKEFIIYKGYS